MSCDPILVIAHQIQTRIETKTFGAILASMKDDILEIAFKEKEFLEISDYCVYIFTL